MSVNTTVKRIIYVDDDPDDRLFFKRSITKNFPFIHLTLLSSGNELIQALEQAELSPDLIFLDLNMPGMNGFETLQEIKNHALFQSIPVIIYSTSGEEQTYHTCYRLGANFYIQKPSFVDKITEAIERALSIHNFSQPEIDQFVLYSQKKE